MIIEDICEIREYINKHPEYKPLYSLRIGDQPYIGIGLQDKGKLFACTSSYATLSDYFLGRYYICDKYPDEYPQEFIRFKELVERERINLNVTDEIECLRQLDKLIYSLKIPHTISMHRGVDISFYGGYYIIELKVKFAKNMYSNFYQIINYMVERKNCSNGMLFELKTGNSLLLQGMKGYNILNKKISFYNLLQMVEENVCHHCPIRFDSSFFHYKCLSKCPSNKVKEYIKSMSDANKFEIGIDWVRGKLKVANEVYSEVQAEWFG